MGDIDRTELVDNGLSETWRCPHCGKKWTFSEDAENILFENMTLIQQCMKCGNLHYWKLKLTDEFKKKVVAMIRRAI